MNNLRKLEEILGYKFKDIHLLENALIHRSYTNEHKDNGIKNNERLEFLGDAVLEIIVSDYLYKTSEKQEGDLSKMRASIVCEQALSSWALENNIGNFLILGHGEDVSGGRKRPSVLSNTVEAIIGAIYLDSGFEKLYDIVINNIVSTIINNKDYFVDNKTALQELVQEYQDVTLRYRVIDETGPDHGKMYTVETLLNDINIAIGKGSSKKAAQQEAAKKALEFINSQENKINFWSKVRSNTYVFKRSRN